MHRTLPRLLGAIALSLSLMPVPASADPAHPAATGTSVSGAARASGRILVRLRPEIARTAWLERRSGLRANVAGLTPAPALDALSRRLSARWLEPEFPGEAPGGTPDLSTFWIAHLEAGVAVESALTRANASSEVAESSTIGLVALEPMTFEGEAAIPDAGSWKGLPTDLVAPVPNDSMWGLCWWLEQPSRRDIHAREAWEHTIGDSASIIAILDTGILRWHPDLAGTEAGKSGRLWTNAAETNGLPGVDDDGNGFVDDTWGWDFVALDSAHFVRPGEDWRDADNDPNDFAVHGTAVAGVAAGIANNHSGALGTAPGARIMAVRVAYSAPIAPTGLVDMTFAAQGILYAVRNGATVINCSFGTIQQADLQAAAQTAISAGVVIVTAAGNGSHIHPLASRSDVISVAATDASDKITRFSTTDDFVDLAAPGQGIATTTLRPTGTDSIGLRTPSYSSGEAGTSFSSPMVAGAVALLQAKRRARGEPPLPPDLVRQQLFESTVDISALNPAGGFGSGRLDLQLLIEAAHLSTGIRVGASTVGPGVFVPGLSGGGRLVHVTSDGNFVVWNPTTGDTLVRAPLGGLPAGGLAAADPGAPYGNVFFAPLVDGRIAGLDLAGVPLPGWPVAATGSSGPAPVVAALADLDGDGKPEIVWGGNDGNVWAWRIDGSRVPGFPRVAGIAGRNLRVALGDLDGAPGAEIAVTGDDDSLRVFMGNGAPRVGFPVYAGHEPLVPVLLRFDPAETPTIVVGAGFDLRGYDPQGAPRFSRTYYGSSFAVEMAAGDLDGSGRIVLVAPGILDRHVYVIDGARGLVAERAMPAVPVGGALVGPLRPGTGLQIAVPLADPLMGTRYEAYDDTLGVLHGWPKLGHAAAEGSLGDFDADGATELDGGSASGSMLYVYEAASGSARPATTAWPTMRANVARTSSVLATPTLEAVDDLGPIPVTDLASGLPRAHDVPVTWTAPGDAGSGATVRGYDVRIFDAPPGERGFDAGRPVATPQVPSAPGTFERFVVAGLEEGATQWIALRSRDAAGNWSETSNAVAVTTPVEPPAPVTGLHPVAGGTSSVTFAWIATGEDGRRGRPAAYRVRLATAPLDSAAFASAALGADVEPTTDAGGEEQVTVTGLTRGVRYWAAVAAVDGDGRFSALAPPVDFVVGRLVGTSGVRLLPVRSPSTAPVEIEWRGSESWADGPQRIEIFDLGGRRVRALGLPAEPDGVAVWDGKSNEGRAVREGVYFLRIASGGRRATSRIILLR